jgi:transcriptional antiterminator RfaH
VHTNIRKERLAHKELRKQGYETLYLHYLDTVRHARRVIGVLKPLFPRYVFVAIRPGQSLYAVEFTLGVAGVVHCGAEPLEIPARVIAELRARGDENGRTDAPGGKPLGRRIYRTGETVRIKDGPLQGLLATMALDAGGEVRIWLNMFGGRVEAVLDPLGVEPASPEGGAIPSRGRRSPTRRG